jgi:hypothetical protein
VPFGAKLGLTRSEIGSEELDWLAVEYARAHGHEPEGHWIIIVHPDESSEFHRFDNREDMWCCAASPLINRMLAWELHEAGSATVEPR